MLLSGEKDYALHELRLDLSKQPSAEVWLVDDTNGQVLGMTGQLRTLELTSTGLWGEPIGLEELRLEPSSRDVTASVLLRHHALTLEVNELHTHYRRLQVYEQWMGATDQPDDPATLPDHMQVHRFAVSVPLNQLEIEMDLGDARRVVTLSRVASIELDVTGMNKNAFVHRVEVGPIDETARRSLLEFSGLQGGALAQLQRRLSSLRSLQLEGQDFKAVVLFDG